MRTLSMRFIEPKRSHPYLRLVPTPEEAKLERYGASLSIYDLIASLGPGSRTKEEIDRQIKEERDSWDRE